MSREVLIVTGGPVGDPDMFPVWQQTALMVFALLLGAKLVAQTTTKKQK